MVTLLENNTMSVGFTVHASKSFRTFWTKFFQEEISHQQYKFDGSEKDLARLSTG